EGVGAPGLAWQETPRQLVVPARAALERRHSPADALVDGVVQADVEVQERVVLETPPVAPVQPAPAGDVEGARHQAALPARLDDLERLGHPLEDQVVEGAVQPA